MATSGQVQRSLHKFKDLAVDLVASDSDNFSDRLSVFMNFCKMDDFLSGVAIHLKAVANPLFDNWYVERTKTIGGMVGSGELIFPLDEQERMAFQFEILNRINDGKWDLFQFTHGFFSVNSRFDEHIRALNNNVTKPLVREMQRKFDEVIENLPEDRRADVSPAIYQIINHGGTVIQQNASGTGISQTASMGLSEELKTAFSDLRAAIASLGQEEETRKGHEDIIDQAESIAGHNPPKRSVVMALLNALPAIATVVGAVQHILNLLK